MDLWKSVHVNKDKAFELCQRTWLFNLKSFILLLSFVSKPILSFVSEPIYWALSATYYWALSANLLLSFVSEPTMSFVSKPIILSFVREPIIELCQRTYFWALSANLLLLSLESILILNCNIWAFVSNPIINSSEATSREYSYIELYFLSFCQPLYALKRKSFYLHI